MSLFNLTGKVAVVTGGNGLGMARELATAEATGRKGVRRGLLRDIRIRRAEQPGARVGTGLVGLVRGQSAQRELFLGSAACQRRLRFAGDNGALRTSTVTSPRTGSRMLNRFRKGSSS